MRATASETLSSGYATTRAEFPDSIRDLHLTRAQVYECLAYYEDHRGEIDALVAEQMADDLK